MGEEAGVQESGTAKWQRVRFDPARRGGHVESYFLKANDPEARRAVWIKATILRTTAEPDRPIAEGWAIAFDRGAGRHVGVKHDLPFGAARFGDAGLDVGWRRPSGDFLELKEGASRGAIAKNGSTIRWDLRFEGELGPMVQLPSEALYDTPLPSSKLVTPVPDARFDGEVIVDGERWPIVGWRGMQGHNWGKRHAPLYGWCHANVWEQPDSEVVVESVSARVALGPFRLPLLTAVCVRHRGVAYDFTRPGDVRRAEAEVSHRRYAFSTEGPLGRVEGLAEAETDDMVGLHYANPDGTMTYCLNSKLARLRLRFEPAGRAPFVLTSRAAALEIGTMDDAHGVRMAL